MDGRSASGCSDSLRLADRRCLRARFVVLFACASGTAHKNPRLSFAVAAAVSTGGRMEIDSVFAAFGRADGRYRHAVDAFARRERVCGRNDDRHRAAARRIAFGRCRALYAECAAQTAIGPKESLAAHGDRDSAVDAYLPSRRADRQRESAERTVERITRRSDRSTGRPTAESGTVQEAFRKRRSLGRTSGLGHADRVQRRGGRLHLRTVADADRSGAGNSAGNPVTV